MGGGSPAGLGKGTWKYLNFDLAVDTELATWSSGEATPKVDSMPQGKNRQAGRAQQTAGG